MTTIIKITDKREVNRANLRVINVTIKYEGHKYMGSLTRCDDK